MTDTDLGKITYCVNACTTRRRDEKVPKRTTPPSKLCRSCEDRLREWLEEIPTNAALAPAVIEHGKHRIKLVRDSFTMPRDEFERIARLKARAIDLKRPAKKSELLRAGLQVLERLDDASLLATLNALQPIKTGRPKKRH